MLTRKKIIQLLRNESPLLRSRYGVKRIGLFGSFATGKAGRTSDIDLVVEFNENPGLDFFQMLNYLEKKLGRRADILTPAGLKSIRSKSIAKSIRKNLFYV